MKQDLSYSKYREEIQKLAFQKEKILKLANEKTEAHRNYRKYWKIWNEKQKEHDKQVQELLKVLPSRT
jgi:hypothetical protein